MDRTGANFEASIESIHNKLGANAWPVLLPLGKEDELRGQIDVINRKAIIYSEDDELGSIYEVQTCLTSIRKPSTRLTPISLSRSRTSTTSWPKLSFTNNRSR